MGERVLVYDPATKAKSIVEVDDADAFEADADARGLLYAPDSPANRKALSEAIAGLGATPAPAPAAPAPQPQQPAHAEPDPEPDQDVDDATAAAPGPSKAEAVARGAGQSASLGFGDEMAGVGAWLASLADSPEQRARTASPGIGAPLAAGNEYTRGRDLERVANAQAQEAQPGAYLGGEILGGLATAAAPIGGAARGATMGARAINAAKAGAAIGGASGFGAGEGSALEQGGQAALGAGAGALLGAGSVPVVESAVVPAARWAAGKSDKFGDYLAGAFERRAAGQRAHANDMRLKRLGAQKAQVDMMTRMSDDGVSAYPDDEAMQLLRGGKDRYAEDFRRLGIKDPESASKAYNAAAAESAAVEGRLREAGAGVSPSALAADIRSIGHGKLRAGKGAELRGRTEQLAEDYARLGGERTKQVKVPPAEPESVVTETVEYPLESMTHKIPANLRRGSAGRFESGGAPIEVPVDVVEPVELTKFVKNEPTVLDVQLPEERIPWDQARAERADWGKATNFASGTPDQALRSQIYGAHSQALERAADEAIPGSGAAWRQAQNDKHMGLTALRIAGNAENAATARNMLSPSDKTAGALAFLNGDPLMAPAASFANNLLRRSVTPAREGNALAQERFARWMAEGLRTPPGGSVDAAADVARRTVVAPSRLAPTFAEGFAAPQGAAEEEDDKSRRAARR